MCLIPVLLGGGLWILQTSCLPLGLPAAPRPAPSRLGPGAWVLQLLSALGSHPLHFALRYNSPSSGQGALPQSFLAGNRGFRGNLI